MLIIGSTELTFTSDAGSFHCPHCDLAREYRLRYRREFLTIYFIPLIPLRKLGEFAECSTCRQTFEPDVVKMSPEEIRVSKRRSTLEMIRRVLVVIVAADTQVTDEELEAVRQFSEQVDLPEVTREQILHEAEAVHNADLDPVQYIRHVAGQLSEEDKDLLVLHAFLAATAAGQLSDARQEVLKELPDAVGVPEWRFRAIIAEASESS
jgi:uncharacterized tellurite resistance protein B-like protein